MKIKKDNFTGNWYGCPGNYTGMWNECDSGDKNQNPIEMTLS